ncbi:hypothetical protein PVAP13_6NG120400 [Panicum virgatum]|uniref:Secreted protein n=1 Tax=Panicum virgatum TaxID=38727 RepID=A0A8T0R008_PANVG|nr:hypothetical protein PVAP13_6NG120400 [Panicum virgatum]
MALPVLDLVIALRLSSCSDTAWSLQLSPTAACRILDCPTAEERRHIQACTQVPPEMHCLRRLNLQQKVCRSYPTLSKSSSTSPANLALQRDRWLTIHLLYH